MSLRTHPLRRRTAVAVVAVLALSGLGACGVSLADEGSGDTGDGPPTVAVPGGGGSGGGSGGSSSGSGGSSGGASASPSAALSEETVAAFLVTQGESQEEAECLAPLILDEFSTEELYDIYLNPDDLSDADQDRLDTLGEEC